MLIKYLRIVVSKTGSVLPEFRVMVVDEYLPLLASTSHFHSIVNKPFCFLFSIAYFAVNRYYHENCHAQKFLQQVSFILGEASP